MTDKLTFRTICNLREIGNRQVRLHSWTMIEGAIDHKRKQLDDKGIPSIWLEETYFVESTKKIAYFLFKIID